MNDKITKAIELYETLQEKAYELITSEDKPDLIKKKVGTVLVLSVMEKINNGKLPNCFTEKDWKDIAENVTDYTIKMDGARYSALVFLQYANYIDASVEYGLKHTSDKTKKQILLLAEELRSKTEEFSNGVMREAEYVNECLWICLEAMIKLLAASAEIFIGEEKEQLVQAITVFSVAYAKYVVYSKELGKIYQYLDEQQDIDKQIRLQLDNYQEEIDKKSKEFNELVNHAFDENFATRLNNSAELAVEAGIDKENVLDTLDKIDDFFL